MIAYGKEEYFFSGSQVVGLGLSWTPEELDMALIGPVAETVFDESGTNDINTLLEGLAETEFDYESIQRVLNYTDEPEDWRVGEALAELFLVDHRRCEFPWPDGRDEKKSNSSLPGADLVGFIVDNGIIRFAFGEVKTSTDSNYPPGSMYGRTGLKQQLNDLRDKVRIRDDLVKYLGYRAVNASWKRQYKQAVKRYISINSDVRVFGVLIRDVPPNNNDIRVRVESLRINCPTPMFIELIAIYLPTGSIATLSNRVVDSRK